MSSRGVSISAFPRRRGVGRRVRGVTIGPARPQGSRITAARRALTRLGATSMRYRRAAPTTMRQRRNVVRPQRVLPTPGSTSQSMLKLSRRPTPQVKAMKRVGAPNYYVTNFAAQTQCQQGFQNYSTFAWQSNKDIQTMITKVPNNNTLIPGTYRTNRFVLESMIGELLISNSSLASAYVEIYDIARRRDANVTEFPFTNDPGFAWQQGAYDASQGSLADYTVLHSSPFDSQVFRDFFKVVKRTRVELSQGATHRHAVVLKSNRLIDAAVPNFVDGDAVGLTMYTMVVFNGQPASVPLEAGAVVTTAAIALDYVQSWRYKYTYVQDTTNAMFITDNLTSIVGEQVISLGAGQIVPNAKV